MSYRNNRPAQRNPEPEQARQQDVQQPAQPVVRSRTESPTKKSKRKIPLLLGVVVAIIIAAAVVGYFLVNNAKTSSAGIDSSRYQAVFFTNGQVYFGKLSSKNDEYMSLKNVYYLQTKNAEADSSSKTSPQSASKQNTNDVDLIKLGNEIHGPDDEMIISRDQILFFENLKPAGTVSQTITNYQKQNK